MIRFFRAKAGKTLDTITMEEAGISKVQRIDDITLSKHAGKFPVAEIRGMANGDVDIAVCKRASDGETVYLPVPKGQKFTANF